MLKVMIRKQLRELFRGFFVNRRTGKARSRGTVIGVFAGFSLLLLFLAFVFFMFAYLLGDGLFALGMDWLYFVIMGAVALGLGVFGSVFNTYSALYLAKDNDLLFSLPIPPRTLLMSRLVSVYLMSLLYSGIVWIPTIIQYWIFQDVTTAAIVFDILLGPILALFITVLTCALGWVVALLSKKLKNKGILTAFIGIVFLGGYMILCSNLENVINSLIASATSLAGTAKAWLNLTTQMSYAACGNVSGMLIYCGVVIVLAVLCFVIMSRTFIRLATGGEAQGKRAEYREKAVKPRSVSSALLMRELKRFTASSTYMLNCGLTIVVAPALAVFVLIKQNALNNLAAMIGMYNLNQLLPLFGLALFCTLIGLDATATPTVSLESKNLWIVKTLPVTTRQVLHSKVLLQVVTHFLPLEISLVLVSISVHASPVITALMLVQGALFLSLLSRIDLMIGLKRPNMHWTSEQAVIKQGLNPLLGMLAGLAISVANAGLGLLLEDVLSVTAWMAVFTVIEGIALFVMERVISTSGVRTFEQL